MAWPQVVEEGKSMKALLSVAPGGPETLVLSERPRPSPGQGELCVRVLACAINFPDVLIIEDKYQTRPERPFAPGSEVSGVVEAVGRGSRAGGSATG
jgi:NADPH:quinone reductase-like Zn-dependent oxidoreductase